MKQQFTAIIMQEDAMFVAQNPETGVASQGDSVEEALANLREALELYLEEAEGVKPTVNHALVFLTTMEI